MASPTSDQPPPAVPPPEDPSPDQASPQLLAPPGWQKKIASLKKGGTPKKKDVYFVAPDGEEIKSKRLLDRYLKSHPGGPASSEFDWSAGDTPTRRSSRLSAKVRPSLESPEGGSGRKRRKKDTEELPLDEEEEPDKLVAAVPPIAAEQEEVIEEAEKGEENKTKEDTVAQPIEDHDDDGKEPEPVAKQMESAGEATAEGELGGMPVDEEKEPEGQIPAEENLAGEQFEVTKVDLKMCEGQDAEKDQLDTQDDKVHLLEEQKDQKEVSDKMSTGFQQFSEAQNSSMPVDVSI